MSAEKLTALKAMVNERLIVPYGAPNPRSIVPQKLQADSRAVGLLRSMGIQTYDSRIVYHCDLEAQLNGSELNELMGAVAAQHQSSRSPGG